MIEKFLKDVQDVKLRVPILSWCSDVETGAREQAENVANLPFVFKHVALMADAHQGYGMPIGGVAACINAVVPNMVGVDIGCGMGFVQTDLFTNDVSSKKLNDIIDSAYREIPVGEGNAYKDEQYHPSLFNDLNRKPYMEDKMWRLAQRNMGTLGGGNHFIELQEDNDGYLCVMLHSGSRNFGYFIATFYHKLAVEMNRKWFTNISCEDLAFFPSDSVEGQDYLRDMNLALLYAIMNRQIMMSKMLSILRYHLGGFNMVNQVNINHNYASLENHLGKNVFVHRKGATSAEMNKIGIIPGSMGKNSASYLVRGLGNDASFRSCSHGAGRVMGRNAASERLTKEEVDLAMEGVVFRGWKKQRKWKKDVSNKLDFGEAPQAYKDIEEVIKNQSDLVVVEKRMTPLGVIKG